MLLKKKEKKKKRDQTIRNCTAEIKATSTTAEQIMNSEPDS